MKSDGTLDLVTRLQAAANVNRVMGKAYDLVQSELALLMRCEDETMRWWWESPAANRFVFSYDENLSFYSELMGLSKGENRQVYIFVTGDKVPPWECFIGDFNKISAEIEESSLTEFIILDSDFKWAMADTHHNQLMLYGHYAI